MNPSETKATEPARRTFPGEATPETRSLGTGGSWRPRMEHRTYLPGDIDAKIAESTLDNNELHRLVGNPAFRPPQAWFDGTNDPFQPRED